MFVDSSFLADLGRGNTEAVSYFRDHDRAAFASSTVVAFELFAGLVDQGAQNALADLRYDLDWVDFVELSLEDAHEAATIQAELESDGTRISIPDVLVAAATRRRGETLVAADAHFERVEGLEYVNFRR